VFAVRLFKSSVPPCPACGSKNTITGRRLRLAGGLGIGLGGSLICYLAGFFYPLGRILIPFLLVAGFIIAIFPSPGRYCCLDCDAYWNPETPHIHWRPKRPGL
jgi:hypothetical protein